MFEFKRLAIIAFVACFSQPAAANHTDGDVKRGEQVFKKCRSCHRIGDGATNRVGPQLNGLYQRAAGSVDGFKYSASMLRAGADGLVWDHISLDTYLENPKSLISKTRMSFRGLKDADDRADVMAYLRRFSDDPSNIPEASPTRIGTDHEVDPTILALQGDPEYGEYLSSECVSCHQIDGTDTGIPSITNWPIEDFVIAMHAYKDKNRVHPVMQMMAGRLSAEEIAGLAAYFEKVGQ
jgi:cytochrome c